MAFIFSTSHLPQTRVRRPDHLEDEEEDDDVMQPMPRAGGVRAFSHLPPARALADSSSPLSTRPATPVGRPRPYTESADDQDTSRAPAESDHDDASRAHADYADDTLWHSPRITTQDQPPESHQEDDHAQEEGDHPAPSMHRDSSRTRSSGFSPSPQDLRDAFHPPAPDSPTREAPNQDNRPAQPRGLLFESRQPPGLRDQGAGQFRSMAGKAEYHDMVLRPSSSAEDERGQREGLFQNVASGSNASPHLAQATSGARLSRPAAAPQPPQGRGSTAKTQPAVAGARPTPPPGGSTAQQPQSTGSLAKYRQQKQKILDQQQAGNKLSEQAAKKMASITRNMESIALAVHLINHTKQKGEADLDPESVDENSAEFKRRLQTAINRLHGGSAPWMDHLAANFGEREKAEDGSPNARLKKTLGINPAEKAWCGYSLGDAMAKAGITPPNTAGWAGNWREWGKQSGPNAGGIKVGDVYHIKYDKDGTGHVATVVGISKDGTQVFCLGGNQNDGLNISAYPIGAFTDSSKPGKYPGATIVFKKPADQQNNIPAPTFDYNADSSTFDILAGLTR